MHTNAEAAQIRAANKPVTYVDQNGLSFTAHVFDPSSGFMVPAHNFRGSELKTFSLEKKLKFLEVARMHYPNISKICDIAKISWMTYKEHLLFDQKFCEELECIRQAQVDNVEGNMFTFSQRPANFMDRMAILRAYRGNLFNPATKIQHVGQEVTPDQALKRRIGLATVVDAEVVTTSAEILDAEVVVPEQLAGPVYNNKEEEKVAMVENLQVPGPSSPAQSPAGIPPHAQNEVTVIPSAMVTKNPRSRDPITLEKREERRLFKAFMKEHSQKMGPIVKKERKDNFLAIKNLFKEKL